MDPQEAPTASMRQAHEEAQRQFNEHQQIARDQAAQLRKEFKQKVRQANKIILIFFLIVVIVWYFVYVYGRW